MSVIETIQALEILDSRGNPTIEVNVVATDGSIGRAAVPSGASTGSYEAVELRDGDAKRYHGKGVQQAISNITNLIYPQLKGKSCLDQRLIDQIMIDQDGTNNKSHLGANAMLAVSLAVAKCRAVHLKKPLYQVLDPQHATPTLLPMPMVNVLNGGAHADSNVDFQEFMLVPTGAESFTQALQWVTEIFHNLKSILKSQNLVTSVGDEGGFAPNLSGTQHALDLLVLAIEKSGFKPGQDIHFALDVAANEFYKDSHYHLYGFDNPLTAIDLVKFYQKLTADYPIVSIEDGLAEDDFRGWQELTQNLTCQVVGDDLFVTNKSRLQRGIGGRWANAILIKLNQIGTLTETLDAIKLAQGNGLNCIVSHRSGETEDTTIADLAVATECGQIKTGSVSRTDRVAKYNQLLRIEHELGSQAQFINPFAR